MASTYQHTHGLTILVIIDTNIILINRRTHITLTMTKLSSKVYKVYAYNWDGTCLACTSTCTGTAVGPKENILSCPNLVRS